MKKNWLILLFILWVRLLNAQYLDLSWVKGTGASGMDNGLQVLVDPNGDIYTSGDFTGTIDFDPGPGVFNMTSTGLSAVYISKFDTDGNFLWAKKIGGNSLSSPYKMVMDPTGAIYISGSFLSNMDLDPGLANYLISSAGHQDIFVVKLDAAGNFIWGKRIGGALEDDYASVMVGNNGDVYITGSFIGTTDFDPGPGTYNITSTGSWDVFVCKLDLSGNFVWAKKIGGTESDFSLSIGINASDEIHVSGTFIGTSDFDPGPGITNLAASGFADAFVCKLNNSGTFIWARRIGGTGQAGAHLTVTASGDIFLTGYFSATADMDPGPGTYDLITRGSNDVFIVKLDNTGNLTWVKHLGGTGPDGVYKVAIDGNGNIYVAGSFSATVDFDPGLGTYDLIAAGNWDIFVARFDPAGNFYCAKQMGGTGYESCISVATAGPGVVYMTGYFDNTAEFNPCLNTASLTSAGNHDIYLVKLELKTATVSISSSKVSICEGDPVTFNAAVVDAGPSPVYEWQVNGIITGTNSPSYTTNALTNGDIVKVIVTSPCLRYTPVHSNEIQITVDAKVNPEVTIAPFPATICYGTLVTFTASAQNGGSNPSFEWRLNGVIAGTGRSSFVTNTLDNGDEIYCIMTSNASAACLATTKDTSDRILIKIDPAICPIGFYMPTGFTPNGDAKNDLCKPLLFGKVITYKFTVYNRWGQRVFATTDINKGWDGRIQGKEQDNGIFVWVCTYQFKDQPLKTEKGTITLIR